MKKITFLFLCIFIVLVALAQTDKEKIELGVQKFNADKQTAAYKILFPLSDSKYFNADAEYCMGVFYKGGVNSNSENIYLRSDEDLAIKWFTKAANHGNIDAFVSLGNLYSRKSGNGYYKKYTKEALKWYKKATDKGSCYGQVSLGDAYANGIIGPQDYLEAFKWHRKSADEGCAMGILSIAGDYENGYGTNKDIKEATRLYLSLMDKEDNNYILKRAIILLCRIGETTKPLNLFNETEEILMVNKGCKMDVSTEEFQRLLVKNSSSIYLKDTALNWLGYLYDQGKGGVSVNYNEAFKFFKKAAEMGYTKAQYNLASYYASGKGITKNEEEAFKWFLKTAQNNDDYGQYKTGYYLKYGIGVKKNEQEAVKWFQKSAEQNIYLAEYHLGLAYRDGRGVEQNNVESQKWLGAASKLGYVLAQELFEGDIAAIRQANANAVYIAPTYNTVDKGNIRTTETIRAYHIVCKVCNGLGKSYKPLPNGGVQFTDANGSMSTLYGKYEFCNECRGGGYELKK